MKHCSSQPEVDALLTAAEAVLLKHGAHCPISARARDELTTFATAHPDVALGALEVTAHRDLSTYAAQRLGIEHQSPQVFVLRGGKVAWTAVHYEITAQELEDQLGLGA